MLVLEIILLKAGKFGFQRILNMLNKVLVYDNRKCGVIALDKEPGYSNAIAPKGKILLIGNADTKEKLGSMVDEFDGDVARFGRFHSGHEEYFGKKVTLWFINRPLILNEELIWLINQPLIITENGCLNNNGYFFTKSWEHIKTISPELKKGVMMTYIGSDHEFTDLLDKTSDIDNLDVADTRLALLEFKAYSVQFIKKGGQLNKKTKFLKHIGGLQKNNTGVPKPSTGMIAILYCLHHYKEVYLCNFDFGKTNHYWGVKTQADEVIGAHNFHLEESIVNVFIDEGSLKWLK